MRASAQSDVLLEPNEATDIPLQPVSSSKSKNPDTGPSSPPIPEVHDARAPFRPCSIEGKSKTMTELKKELEERCAEIEAECPEIKHRDGWGELHEILKKRDATDLKNNYDNIDTLLVFAGLYSAILTAFVVEAYKLLQRDSSDASLQVLVQISQQLDSFAIASGFVNATYIPSSLPTGPFVPQRDSIWLNGLWFVALVLSLIAASLGLLVKQWLREYADNPGITPEEQRRIRCFRIRGLRKYKVYEIATFLPLLLQISLSLFFAGLVIFTRAAHTTIGWVITVLVVAWGVFLVITTFLPWFSASCPYKTPFLNPITTHFKHFLNNLNRGLEAFAHRQTWRSNSQFWGWLWDWLYFKLPHDLFGDDEETQFSKKSSSDAEVLLVACETSGNTNVRETIMHCIDPQHPFESLSHLSFVLAGTSSLSESETLETITQTVWNHLPWDRSSLFVKSMVTCVRLRLLRAIENKEGSKLDEVVVGSLLQLDEFSDTLVRNTTDPRSRPLWQMTSALLRAALSAPFTGGSLLKYTSRLLEQGIKTLSRLGYFNSTAMRALIEASNAVLEQPGILEDEYEFIGQCRAIIFCAGRSTEESRPVVEAKFSQLSCHIASKVNSLPDPEGERSPYVVFQWHCLLDMAMRLHKRLPGIIDETLFNALHTRSLKLFYLYLKSRLGRNFWKYLGGKSDGVSQLSFISTDAIDWIRVLDEYAEVEIRNVGKYTEYGDKWDYQRLGVDHKHRMEFMLNFEDHWETTIRRTMREFQF